MSSARAPNERPSRPLSAYNYFFRCERERMLQEERNFIKSLDFTGLSKHIGKQWKKADAHVRSKYKEMAARDKKRYALELLAWHGAQERFVTTNLQNEDRAGPEEEDDFPQEESHVQNVQMMTAAPEPAQMKLFPMENLGPTTTASEGSASASQWKNILMEGLMAESTQANQQTFFPPQSLMPPPSTSQQEQHQHQQAVFPPPSLMLPPGSASQHYQHQQATQKPLLSLPPLMSPPTSTSQRQQQHHHHQGEVSSENFGCSIQQQEQEPVVPFEGFSLFPQQTAQMNVSSINAGFVGTFQPQQPQAGNIHGISFAFDQQKSLSKIANDFGNDGIDYLLRVLAPARP